MLLNELDKLDKIHGVTFGLNKVTGHRYDIDKFILEMRWRMANRNRARNEDKTILKKINGKMNVEIN